MKTQPNHGLRIVLAIVFAGLGLMRLYSFAQTSLPADGLSGLGLLALAAGYFMSGPSRGSSAAARYLTIAGVALVLVAIVLRLTG